MIHPYQDFEFDELLYQIRHRGEPLSAPPRVFDLIVYLFKNKHRVVSKKELKHSVWLGLSVTDGAIEQVVRRSKLLFSTRGADESPISTVRGRGYRFLP